MISENESQIFAEESSSPMSDNQRTFERKTW